MTLFLLRYAEMGLKSEKVRRRFQQSLIENMERHFLSLETECIITNDRGRIYVLTDNSLNAREVISHTFGIVSFSEAVEAKSGLEDVIRAVVGYASPRVKDGISFAIRARRSGQQKYTSLDLARDAGAAILDAFPGKHLSVDLESPDIEIHIDAREKGSYIYAGVELGPGGLPLGTQGTVLCPVSDEREMLAGWLMMRRGCNVIAASVENSFISTLRRWNPRLKLCAPAPVDKLPERARQLGCRGIAYALSYSEIAEAEPPKDGLAIFYPLAGLTENETARLIAKLL